MKRRIHTSWVLAWSSIGILSGVLLSLFSEDYFIEVSWLVIGLSLIALSLINRKIPIIALALLGGISIGLWRGTQNYQSQNVYREFTGQQVRISGVVSEDVAFGKDGQQQIKIKEVMLDGKALTGQIWLSTGSKIEIKRSDKVEVSGKLSEGFGSFPASMHRAEIEKAVRVKHGDVGLELRDWFSSAIRQVVNEPEASLGIGFLTGQNSTLPESLSNNLKILGLTHIIVASGYNLTILVRFARGALVGTSKYLATLGSGLLITTFILVTGASPSMTRAGLITGLSLAAWYYGRRIHPLVLLPFAAAITVLFNPSYLLGDLGWYLSFAAFAGVIILAPLITNYFWGDKKPNPVARVVVETLSAQILTVPLIAFTFGQYAPLALVSNLLILPLIPLAMIFTFFAGIAGVISNGLSLIGIPAEWILGYMTFTVEKLAGLPISQGEISFSPSYLILSYLAIIIFAVWLWRRTKHDFNEDSIIE